uniref:Uncharacterized protein n=1 Tax=viral metagenome TaxID=1070528 RepID=A0A6C0C7P4_9ZZZZ
MENIEELLKSIRPARLLSIKNHYPDRYTDKKILYSIYDTNTMLSFYRKIYPYHNKIRKILNIYGWTSPEIIYYNMNVINNSDIMLEILKNIK